jgi:uncharacterized membrane protein
MRHAAAALATIAFIFLAAAYVPRNRIKARLHHPMTLGIKTGGGASDRQRHAA